MSFKVISAEEAALHIHDDDNVGFGGFTAAGTPKVVPQAIARRAEEEHAAGPSFPYRRFYRSLDQRPSRWCFVPC